MRGRGEGSYSFNESESLFVWRLKIDDRSIVRKAKTQKELRAKVKAAIRELDERGGTLDRDQKRLTVSAWLHHWLETYVKPHRSASTYRQYEQLVRLYMAPAIGSVNLQVLTTSHVQNMLNDLGASGKAAGTQQLVRVVLRRALSIAMKCRLILSNPVDSTERPKLST